LSSYSLSFVFLLEQFSFFKRIVREIKCAKRGPHFKYGLSVD